MVLAYSMILGCSGRHPEWLALTREISKDRESILSSKHWIAAGSWHLTLSTSNNMDIRNCARDRAPNRRLQSRVDSI